jgi:hypothetical protein
VDGSARSRLLLKKRVNERRGGLTDNNEKAYAEKDDKERDNPPDFLFQGKLKELTK